MFGLVTRFSKINYLELDGVVPYYAETPVALNAPLPQVPRTRVQIMKLEPLEYSYSDSLEPYLSQFIDMPNLSNLQLAPASQSYSYTDPDNDMLVNVLNLATGVKYLELGGFQKFPYPSGTWHLARYSLGHLPNSLFLLKQRTE